VLCILAGLVTFENPLLAAALLLVLDLALNNSGRIDLNLQLREPAESQARTPDADRLPRLER
jgi:hypothetical protein